MSTFAILTSQSYYFKISVDAYFGFSNITSNGVNTLSSYVSSVWLFYTRID